MIPGLYWYPLVLELTIESLIWGEFRSFCQTWSEILNTSTGSSSKLQTMVKLQIVFHLLAVLWWSSWALCLNNHLFLCDAEMIGLRTCSLYVLSAHENFLKNSVLDVKMASQTSSLLYLQIHVFSDVFLEIMNPRTCLLFILESWSFMTPNALLETRHH